jgi:hypothetical protein
MAHILLTSSLNCFRSYGFAGNETTGTRGGQWLSWENLIYIADFLRASGQGQVSLGGGEPTQHPECVDFILYLLERGFDVTLYTHGILSSPCQEEFRCHLAEAPTERFQVVCHLQNPGQTPGLPSETARLHSFLAVMGPWTQGGFTINRPDFSLDFLFEAISRFGMKRQLRLSLAHPVPGCQAGFVQAGEMRRVVARLYDHRQLFETHRVRPDLDCGWPLCKFSDGELGWLQRLRGHAPGGCGPVFGISPDMTVFHCLPLSHYQRKSLFEFDAVEQIDRHFAQLRDEITGGIAGIYPECAGCRSLEDGGCHGGGMCQTIRGGMGRRL